MFIILRYDAAVIWLYLIIILNIIDANVAYFIHWWALQKNETNGMLLVGTSCGRKETYYVRVHIGGTTQCDWTICAWQWCGLVSHYFDCFSSCWIVCWCAIITLLAFSPGSYLLAHALDWTGICKLQCEKLHWNACVQNWLSTRRPSFAIANQVVMLIRVPTEYIM